MRYVQNKADMDAVGFSVVRDLFSAGELNETEKIIDELMGREGRAIKRFKREMAEHPAADRFMQPELSRPALLSRQLRRGAVYAKCQAVAADIFGSDAHYLFDHAIYKMPKGDAITPWHQDQAYLGEHTFIQSLHFWIPFQDVSSVNGSIRFVKSKPTALLPHGTAFASNSHLLSVLEAPTEDIQELALRKGDASIHTSLTVHATGPNHSEQIRKVWVLHFGVSPAWYKHWRQFASRFKRA